MREMEMRKREKEVSVENDAPLSGLKGRTFVKCRGEFVRVHDDHIRPFARSRSVTAGLQSNLQP